MLHQSVFYFQHLKKKLFDHEFSWYHDRSINEIYIYIVNIALSISDKYFYEYKWVYMNILYVYYPTDAARYNFIFKSIYTIFKHGIYEKLASLSCYNFSILFVQQIQLGSFFLYFFYPVYNNKLKMSLTLQSYHAKNTIHMKNS